MVPQLTGRGRLRQRRQRNDAGTSRKYPDRDLFVARLMRILELLTWPTVEEVALRLRVQRATLTNLLKVHRLMREGETPHQTLQRLAAEWKLLLEDAGN